METTRKTINGNLVTLRKADKRKKGKNLNEMYYKLIILIKDFVAYKCSI